MQTVTHIISVNPISIVYRDTDGCRGEPDGGGGAGSIHPPERVDIGKLGEKQLERAEEEDEVLQRHRAMAGGIVVRVDSLEAAASRNLDRNVVANRRHLQVCYVQAGGSWRASLRSTATVRRQPS